MDVYGKGTHATLGYKRACPVDLSQTRSWWASCLRGPVEGESLEGHPQGHNHPCKNANFLSIAYLLVMMVMIVMKHIQPYSPIKRYKKVRLAHSRNL